MAAVVLLVLFLVSFLFNTRIGLIFLAAAIVMLVRHAPHKRQRIVLPQREKPQPAWKDPWGSAG